MNYEFLKLALPLIITSIVTIVGWFMAYRFSVEKDRANKRKDLRVNYLIDAWRKLEFAVNREDYDRVEFLEKPIADIQLNKGWRLRNERWPEKWTKKPSPTG